MGKFGWDLPPGCSYNDIEDAFGDDDADNVCPECGSELDEDDCPVCEGQPVELATGWTCGECEGRGYVLYCQPCTAKAHSQAKRKTHSQE